MLLKRVSALASPVLLDDARSHLRVTGSDEDMLITQQLAAAVAAVSERTGRRLGTETWSASYSSVSGDLDLPMAPVQSITSITYWDANDAQQTAQLTDFYFFADDDFATLRPKPGRAWPSANSNRMDAITVTFVAGYSPIPAPLRTAVLMTLGHLFENREAVSVGLSVAEFPVGVADMVDLYRRGWIGA